MRNVFLASLVSLLMILSFYVANGAIDGPMDPIRYTINMVTHPHWIPSEILDLQSSDWFAIGLSLLVGLGLWLSQLSVPYRPVIHSLQELEQFCNRAESLYNLYRTIGLRARAERWKSEVYPWIQSELVRLSSPALRGWSLFFHTITHPHMADRPGHTGAIAPEEWDHRDPLQIRRHYHGYRTHDRRFDQHRHRQRRQRCRRDVRHHREWCSLCEQLHPQGTP